MTRPDTWMPLYVGDYLRDTGHLSAAEHGAYLLLLMQAWTRGGELPADSNRLRALAQMTPAEWKRSQAAVMEFFTAGDGCFRHKRLDVEIANAAAAIEQRRAAGKASAAARGAKRESNEPANETATAVEREGQREGQRNPQRNAIPSPSPSERKEEREPPSSPLAVPAGASAKPPQADRGTRLPADWVPTPEDRAYAEEQGLDAQRVAADFKGYWLSKAGRDARKVDWSLTWQGWCRREADRRKPPPGREHPDDVRRRKLGLSSILDFDQPAEPAAPRLRIAP